MTSVVVVGAGQAAAQLAMSLRQKGFEGQITLVGDEPHLPYERPPLSKTYLAREDDEDALPLRPASFWVGKDVDVRTGVAVTAIDRTARRVALADATALRYDHLVLATGAEPRRLNVPGAALSGIHLLRSRDDARRLRTALKAARNVVVAGAGFIGLEVAAVARMTGAQVTVIELSGNAMSRVVSPVTADVVVDEHRRRGVDVRLATGMVKASDDEHGHVRQVATADGEHLPCDLLVMGVGVTPSTDLASAAGLECSDGVVVDEMLLTSDPDISAIGDCARFPCSFAGGARVRLEAVQNAVDQAKCVAARLTGSPAPYTAVPWFWTHQYGFRLQVAGLVGGHNRAVVRGSVPDGEFSVFCFDGDRLLGVESVNRPADHRLARGLLAGEHQLVPSVVEDPEADLLAYQRKRPA